jgi:hypothetical protein
MLSKPFCGRSIRSRRNVDFLALDAVDAKRLAIYEKYRVAAC